MGINAEYISKQKLGIVSKKKQKPMPVIMGSVADDWLRVGRLREAADKWD